MAFENRLHAFFATNVSGLEGWKLESDDQHYWKWFEDPIELVAYDDVGGQYPKIAIRQTRGRMTFGWPCGYYIHQFSQPLENALCIDAGGRNHAGKAVFISARDMNMVLEHFEITAE